MSPGRSSALIALFLASFAVEAVHAGGGLHQPTSIGFKRAVYHAASGTTTASGGAGARMGNPFWVTVTTTGWFYGLQNCVRPGEAEELVLDWGDVQASSLVDGFQIGYATDASDPNGILLEINFHNNSNGFGDNENRLLGFWLQLPGRPPSFPYQFVGWIFTFDLEGTGYEFSLGDQDLDDDQLADFAYSYRIIDPSDSTATGPLISIPDPNNPLAAPGVEDAFDDYLDPNYAPCDPNVPYFSTYWFGGTPYAQFHLALYGYLFVDAACNCPEVYGN
ncbi:MAG: hypothetical protein HRF50_13670 [Phycisphaerae bacterium]